MKIVINNNKNNSSLPEKLMENYCMLIKEFPEHVNFESIKRDDENLIESVEKDGKKYNWLIAHIPDDVKWWKIGRESAGEEYIVYREKDGIGTWHGK